MTQPVQYFWFHPEGWIYIGDEIEGARAATDDEIAAHLNAISGQGA